MVKKIFFVCIFLFRGFSFGYTDLGLEFAAGEGDYRFYSFSLEAGNDDFYLKPTVNASQSDSIYPRTDYSLEGAYFFKKLELTGSVSYVPETDGYSNYSFGGDLACILAEDENAFLNKLKAGVFADFTGHEDSYSYSTAASSGGRRSAVSTRVTPFVLKQTGYGLYAEAESGGFEAGVSYSKTSYDREITSDDRAIQTLASKDASVVSAGFPDRSWSASLDFPPYLGVKGGLKHTRTAYLLGVSDTLLWTFSLERDFGPFFAELSWDSYDYGDGLSRDDYFGLSLKIPLSSGK